MDRILVTTNCKDLTAYLDFAESWAVGLELQAFSGPDALSGDWRELLRDHKRQLAGFTGELGFHGAFYDMSSGSRDPEITAVTRRRYRENVLAAGELGAKYVVLHLNYLGPMKLQGYLQDWHWRQVDFWSDFVDEISKAGLMVLLENSWEDQPGIVINVLREVNSPYLRACLDVAHATLYSDEPFEDWLEAFEPYLECCHLNNHDGEHDLHLPLNEGVIDYSGVISTIRALNKKPYMCLELPTLSSISSSMNYLRSIESP